MQDFTILCYGDSNTWGFDPERSDYSAQKIVRYPRHVRWTGLLQASMPDNVQIVEEGLNGRTTNLEHPEPPDRHGARFLPSCLYSHAPIDCVILALGANDVKTIYHRSPQQIRDAVGELVDIIQRSSYGPGMQQAPAVLLMSPIIPAQRCEQICDASGEPLYANAIEKAQQMVPLYRQLAQQKNCYFLDISATVHPSKADGGHLDAKGHAQLAAILQQFLEQRLPITSDENHPPSLHSDAAADNVVA